MVVLGSIPFAQRNQDSLVWGSGKRFENCPLNSFEFGALLPDSMSF